MIYEVFYVSYFWLYMQRYIFDNRNNQKIDIHHKESDLYFKEWEIWRCSLGMNIRSEAFGKGQSFRRPILILKKLSSDTYIAIPLWSQKKEWTRFYEYSFEDEKWYAMLYQVRMLHKNRLQRKMGDIKRNDFLNIKKKLRELLDL